MKHTDKYQNRNQGLNRCITDVFNLVSHIKRALHSAMSPKDAIEAYEQDLIPRGSEGVMCSVENGTTVHNWEKVKQSPVFENGFRPTKGHDTYETNLDHTQRIGRKPRQWVAREFLSTSAYIQN